MNTPATPEMVRDAFARVSNKTLQQWTTKHLGSILAAQRKAAYQEFAKPSDSHKPSPSLTAVSSDQGRSEGPGQRVDVICERSMGDVIKQRPVLLIAAIFSRHPAGLEWAHARFAAEWGPIVLESPRFDHRETTYYEKSMGPDLQKMFLASETLIDPGALPDLKLQANRWEEEYRDTHPHDEPRPLNIDPGYINEAKLVLASTKDRDHRIYLAQGIFAEVTLHFARGGWQTRPWTYPDYQRADYHEFFTRCREYLRQRYRK